MGEQANRAVSHDHPMDWVRPRGYLYDRLILSDELVVIEPVTATLVWIRTGDAHNSVM